MGGYDLRCRKDAKHMKKLCTLLLMLILSVLMLGGCLQARHSRLIVISESKRAILVEPNVPVTVNYPAVLIHRGRYLELIECEMREISGELR